MLEYNRLEPSDWQASQACPPRPSGFLSTTTPTAVGIAANSLSPSPLRGQANTADVVDALKSGTDREGLCVCQGGSLASSVGPLQDSHYNSREGGSFISP